MRPVFSLGGTIFYLGVGALAHLIFLGNTFDWSSVATYGVLFGWPIILMLALGIGFCIVIAFLWIAGKISDLRAARRRAAFVILRDKLNAGK